MCAQDNCGKEINEESIIELAADNIEYVSLQFRFFVMYVACLTKGLG